MESRTGVEEDVDTEQRESSTGFNILVIVPSFEYPFDHVLQKLDEWASRQGTHGGIRLRLVCNGNEPTHQQPKTSQEIPKEWDGPWTCIVRQGTRESSMQHVGFILSLSQWADALVLLGVDAGTLSKMLHGMTDSVLLNTIRTWNVSKNIFMIPAFPYAAWENPMTADQLRTLRKRWTWVRVLQPLLWNRCDRRKRNWSCLNTTCEEITSILNEQVGLSKDASIVPRSPIRVLKQPHSAPVYSSSRKPHLPPELWAVILEYVGDWEIATALGIQTNLPVPHDWEGLMERSSSEELDKDGLEWTLLTSSTKVFISKLRTSTTPPLWLSPPTIKLIIKFDATDILTYLSKHHFELFWSTFGHGTLPTKASAPYGRVSVLEWWKNSPIFSSKEYGHDAVDGASKAGFVHVLDWWRHSGLPMRYTETALEQASSKGNIDVLNWWRRSAPSSGTGSSGQEETATIGVLRLLVGRSICFAALNNQVDVIRWWDGSGIAYAHEDAVAKVASGSGAVETLQLWKELKGEKMIYDNQVLVPPTKSGHRAVLEWWKKSGFKVDYRPCDIEEALEDSVGGEEGKEQVRTWWADNGLNLGVGTQEWMQIKTLQGP